MCPARPAKRPCSARFCRPRVRKTAHWFCGRLNRPDAWIWWAMGGIASSRRKSAPLRQICANQWGRNRKSAPVHPGRFEARRERSRGKSQARNAPAARGRVRAQRPRAAETGSLGGKAGASAAGRKAHARREGRFVPQSSAILPCAGRRHFRWQRWRGFFLPCHKKFAGFSLQARLTPHGNGAIVRLLTECQNAKKWALFLAAWRWARGRAQNSAWGAMGKERFQ